MIYNKLLTFGVAAAACFSFSCLSDPELKDCIDFAIGTDGCPASGCDTYCDEVMTRCPGTFNSRATCISNCASEPVNPSMVDGDFGDEGSNTLECRLTYLRQGVCENVTLLNNPVCVGPDCGEYCDAMLLACPDAYPNQDNCLDNCEAFPIRPETFSEADDDTAQCRLRYAQLALNNSDPTQCDAAGLNGGGVCGDDQCEPYCRAVTTNCTGDNAIYASFDNCMAFCSLMNVNGTYDDWNFQADTVQCRTWHASAPAQNDPVTHCNHTRVYNVEQCGIQPNVPAQPDNWPCATFCDIVERNCSSFPGEAPCTTTCEGLLAAEPFNAVIGPSIYPVSTFDCPTF